MSTEGRAQELLDWVEDALPPDRRAAIDAHLADCPECRAAVREIQALTAGLERLGVRDPSRRAGPGVRVRWALAVAAAIAAVFAVSVIRDAPVAPASSVLMAVGRPGDGPAQLLAVETALADPGDRALLAHRIRAARSVPVRLAALSDAALGATRASELAEAFGDTDDLMVRLWLVVEIARSGDRAAAHAVLAAVDAMGAAAPPELREAVGNFLSGTPAGGGA